MSNEEVWRDIPNFPNYLVSNKGRVRSLKQGRDRFLKPWETVLGYLLVKLTQDGKSINMRVHRLVLLAFIGKNPTAPVTRHLNGNPSDNRLENLAWGTQSENIKDTLIHGTNFGANQTHCKQGHPFSKENTYTYTTGKGKVRRNCRTCLETTR